MPPPSAVAGPAPSGPCLPGTIWNVAQRVGTVDRWMRTHGFPAERTTAGWRGRQADGALDVFGAPGRIRTCDLPLRRRLLYPLSYEGAGNETKVERTRPPEQPGDLDAVMLPPTRA